MSVRLIFLGMILALSGCATCQRHPTACEAVGTAVVAAAIVGIGLTYHKTDSVIGDCTVSPRGVQNPCRR